MPREEEEGRRSLRVWVPRWRAASSEAVARGVWGEKLGRKDVSNAEMDDLASFHRAFGRRGCFSAMSSARPGNAGLSERMGGNGRSIRRAALSCRAATTAGDIFRDRRNNARQKERGFGCPSRGVLGRRGGHGITARAPGAANAIKHRGRSQDQGLGSPIPSGWQTSVIPDKDRSCDKAIRPGAMALRQEDLPAM